VGGVDKGVDSARFPGLRAHGKREAHKRCALRSGWRGEICGSHPKRQKTSFRMGHPHPLEATIDSVRICVGLAVSSRILGSFG
jgi:hypothetical protein